MRALVGLFLHYADLADIEGLQRFLLGRRGSPRSVLALALVLALVLPLVLVFGSSLLLRWGGSAAVCCMSAGGKA